MTVFGEIGYFHFVVHFEGRNQAVLLKWTRKRSANVGQIATRMTEDTHIGAKILSLRESVPMVASNSYEVASFDLNLIVACWLMRQHGHHIVSILPAVIINIVQ